MTQALNNEPRTNNFKPRTPNPELRNGFTVVELLAAMVVSSLVIGFVVSMYLFTEKGMARQEKRSDVRDAVSGCTQRIVTDIRSAIEMERCDDTSLVLRLNPLGQTNYHFDASHAWRNGTLINDPQIDLNVHVFFDEDTLSVQPKRSWSVRVVGWKGTIRDSAIVNISTIISSQEMVNHTMNQTFR